MYALAMTGYGLFTNASTISLLFTKFTSTYHNSLTPKDQQLVLAIQRRLNCIFQPLNVCMMREDSIIKSSVIAAL